MGSQSSAPRDPNGLFWLAQRWFTLFAYEVLIKMLCCSSIQWTETWHTKTWSNHLCDALSISIKIYLSSLLYHHHSQEHFYNWNIKGSAYVEILLINMILIVLIFSQRFECLMLPLVIFGSFSSKRFSYSKIFQLFLVFIAK